MSEYSNEPCPYELPFETKATSGRRTTWIPDPGREWGKELARILQSLRSFKNDNQVAAED